MIDTDKSDAFQDGGIIETTPTQKEATHRMSCDEYYHINDGELVMWVSHSQHEKLKKLLEEHESCDN